MDKVYHNKCLSLQIINKAGSTILTRYFHKLLIIIYIFCFLSPTISSGNWQNYGGDLQHSGYSESPPIPLELRWKFKAGNSEISAPVIDEGILFIGSDRNILYALDSVKGELKWQYSTLGKVYTPAVKNGVVFAASYDNNIYAIDINGNLQWKMNAGSSQASPPLVYHNRLYGGSDKYIYAIYTNNGSISWKYPTNGWIESTPAISQGIVYAGSNDNNLYALDAGKKNLRWKYTTGGNILSSPSVINGIVYVGANDNYIYAIDSISGELKWRKRTNGMIQSSPAVFQNAVYIGSNDNKIYALDKDDGDIIWEFKTNGWVDSQLIVTNDIVYAGSKDGTIYALEREKGTLVSSYKAGSGIISMAISDNMLYAASNDGYVYAMGKEMAESEMISKVVPDLILPELKINPVPLNISSKTLTVSGTATDSSGILIVTVNGIEAGTENWNATLTMINGTNIISIQAVDNAGNIRTDVRTVRYYPPVMEETSTVKTPGFSVFIGIISLIAILFFIRITE